MEWLVESIMESIVAAEPKLLYPATPFNKRNSLQLALPNGRADWISLLTADGGRESSPIVFFLGGL